MKQTKPSLPSINDVLHDEEMVLITPIVLVPENGKIFKRTLRCVLNIPNREMFNADVKALSKGNVEFWNRWKEYMNFKFVSIELAVYFCRHLCPERKVEVRDTMPMPDDNSQD